MKNTAADVPGLHAAAQAILDGRLSVDGYMAACLRRIAADEDRIHAFAFFDRDHVEKRAYVSDRMPAGRRGPIHGIPLAVAVGIDAVELAPATVSSKRTRRVATSDAAIVAQARAAGGIVVGATASAAFGCFGPGSARNPFAEERTAGGSGAAAAVATGMAPLAIDWRPDAGNAAAASYCGVYGLKATRGAIAREGLPLLAPSLDAVGFFVREAVDVSLVAQLFLDHAGLSGMRAGQALETDGLSVRIVDSASGYRIQPAARSALNRAVSALSDKRIEVAHERLSPGFVKAERCYDAIFSYEVAQQLARDRDTLPDAMDAVARSRIDHGRRIDAAAYEQARRDAAAMRSELLDYLEGDTVFLDAAVEDVAPRWEDDSGWSPLQSLWALAGVPTLAVPCGLVDGLPVGVQIAAAPGREDLLARVACLIEDRIGS